MRKYLPFSLLLVATLALLPSRVYTQAAALLFGSNSGTAVAITGTSGGFLNVTAGGGAWAATSGGTGQTTVTTGDLLYGSAANTWSKLADVATGQVLSSGGVGVIPAWSGTPLLTAGTGTQKYHVPGVLFTESISTATGADNNFVKSTTYSIPANTLVNNGDMLELEAIYLQSAEATDQRSYICNYGFTSWTGDTTGFSGGVSLVSHSTTNASVNIHVRSYVKRVSATSFNFWEESLVGGTYQTTVWANSTALTITSAQNIACEARNTDGTPVASATTIKEVQLRYIPYQ